jgi:NTE family protein
MAFEIARKAPLVALLLLPPPTAAGPAAAVPQQPATRPIVGLVLSGGGAGGLAHVGVIAWLEEHRVPIDRVAGTSIGGLVGGLYATGANAADMRALLEQIDWPLLLSADTPYPRKSFRRKEDARDAPATIELGLRNGFSLPRGLDGGHQVGLVVDRIAFPYAGIDSFDRLPTPFACVAVDLAAGEQVVFRDGPLALALRATMSYPGWFTPVRAGGRVLVDGGVLNNLPTDIMRRMGADVVIAVDLGMLATQVEAFGDVLGVLNRTLSVMMRENTDRNAELADLLITPDVSSFGFADFARADEIRQVGYRAAEAMAAELLPLAIDEAAWNAYLDQRRARRRAFAVTPRFIEVEGVVEEDGVGEVDERAVAAVLDHHIGVALDADHLDGDLTDITGWGRYDVVGYQGLVRGGEEGLGIVLHEKTYGPPFLRPILDVRGGEFGEALVSFGGRMTFFDVAGANSELRLDATYGRETLAAAELFVPIGHEGLFIAPRVVAGLDEEFFYEGGESIAAFDVTRAGGGFDIGYLFGPRSQLRLGAEIERQSTEVTVGQPDFASIEGTAGAVRAQWAFDGTDSPIVPTSGVRSAAQARWIYGVPQVTAADAPDGLPFDEELYQASLELTGARRLGGRFSLLASVAGGSSFDAVASPLQQFVVGGPLRLSALGVGERGGSNFYLGRAGVLWALADENRLSFFGTFWLAAIYEVGDAFERSSDPFHDITFGLAGETILGGVFVGVALGEGGRRGFFFAIGRLF